MFELLLIEGIEVRVCKDEKGTIIDVISISKDIVERIPTPALKGMKNQLIPLINKDVHLFSKIANKLIAKYYAEACL